MDVKITCPAISACQAAAKKILMMYKGHRIFAFDGKLGAGKTTMIKSLCREIGIAEMTSSPSFSILNEYRTAADEPVYHFDFFRIKTISEVYDLGYEEFFFSGKYCFIEWAENIRELLPEKYVYIRIEDPVSEYARTFVMNAYG
jgi:tRNA threonylcarbamoyladenosine biosynthesis protein TsaE